MEELQQFFLPPAAAGLPKVTVQLRETFGVTLFGGTGLAQAHANLYPHQHTHMQKTERNLLAGFRLTMFA